MNKNIIIPLLIIIIVFGAYTLFVNDDVSVPATVETATSTVNETVTPVRTETPEETVGIIKDYVGMTVAEASSVAIANDTMFRVVEIDGEPQMVTEDFRVGRINAVVVDGVVITYSIEGENVTGESQAEKTDGHNNPYFAENGMQGEMPTVQNPPEDTDPNEHDEIIGMSTVAAKEYAQTNEVDFRIGRVDGEAMALDGDFKPGRITADVEKDVVVRYTIE
jgi:hypothetical protein